MQSLTHEAAAVTREARVTSAASRQAINASPVVRILGIDPGLRVTGFGVLEISGQKLTYITSGRIRTADKGELPERIRTILEGLSQVIAELKPQQEIGRAHV